MRQSKTYGNGTTVKGAGEGTTVKDTKGDTAIVKEAANSPLHILTKGGTRDMAATGSFWTGTTVKDEKV